MRLTVLVLLTACSARPPIAPARPVPVEVPVLPARWEGPALLASASVVAMGDLIPHTNVQHAAEAAARHGVAHGGWTSLLEPLRTRITRADIAFLNLETPVAPGTGPGSAPFIFDAPPVLLDALVDLGVDVVSAANNHVYDQGRRGLSETLSHLAQRPLVSIGAGATCAEARAHRVVEANGLRIAWLAATAVFNDDRNLGPDQACVAAFDLAALTDSLAAARADADAVILSLHWGREYQHAPTSAQVDAAHRLVEAGADVILGHHPHVVQPVEVLHTADHRTALVAYSLGNLVSNQGYDYVPGVHPDAAGDSRDGLLLAFDLVRTSYGPGTDGGDQTRVHLANVRTVPLWNDNDAGRLVHPAPHIATVAVSDALRSAEAARSEDAVGAGERIQLLRDRWARAVDILGTTWLPEPP